MARTLLVPLDGSKLGEAALPWAVALARARDLTLLLARVIPWPTWVGVGIGGYVTAEVYEQVVEAEQEAAAAYLERAREWLAGRGVAAEVAVREGAIAENLLDLADENDAFAIAMATHGRGGLGRLLFGSVAERVLQQATQPILLVRSGAPAVQAPTLDRLLVPLDGSALAERALDAAQDLAGGGVTLVLLQAIPPVLQTIPGVEAPVPVVDDAATQRALDEAERYLREVGATVDAARYSVETTVRRGEAAEQILAAAGELAVDLVVMASHGRTGAERWWLGSVADEVVRHADRPLFLVSARALAARVIGPYTVRDVMTREPATVRDDEPLVSAVRKLLRRRVSGVPVVNAAGDLVGVVSEHDLVAWQLRLVDEMAKGSDLAPADCADRLESTRAGEVMSRPPVTIDEGAPLGAALRLFEERRVRRLPVTRDGRLVGIISLADALKAMADQWAAARASEAEA